MPLFSKILLNPNHPLTKELTKLYEGVYNQLGSSYGALDIHEFAAELTSNPEFQATLKAIKAPRGGNMFQRMMQAIAEFFGFRKGNIRLTTKACVPLATLLTYRAT